MEKDILTKQEKIGDKSGSCAILALIVGINLF